jgi:hypothetical protein
MDLILGPEVGLVVAATAVAMLDLEEEIPDMVEENQVMDGVTLAMHLTDQVSDVRTDLLRSDHTTTALARPILARSASTLHHSISLVWRRSFQAANWRLLV